MPFRFLWRGKRRNPSTPFLKSPWGNIYGGVTGLNLLSKAAWRENHLLKAFVYSLALAFAVFLPFLIVDNGYFLFYGDFNVQQVPFYQICHDAVRSGNIGWSWTTDLGANFVGSYSFYLLGSPFFWLTIPFPSAAVPYLMGPLLILKFGCAGFAGCLYLTRYVRDPEYAVLGGMLYAFSGFSVYNIFFNHFHEAIIVFPLLLWAMDEYMYHRRRGVFAVTVFASCFVNYYFFVGQVAFCLIYWIVRMLCGSWHISLRDFLLLALESVLGVMMACGLLVPTVMAVIQNPRVDNPPNGWNALLYGWNQRYIHILECFFFPPDIPARPNFTPNSEAKWASLGAWLPLFSMTGVFAFLQSRRSHWLKKVLWILFFMMMVPVLNSAFQLFNSSYYARWFYMLVLMMCLATLIALEREASDWRRAILWVLGITLGIALPIGLMPDTKTNNGVQTKTYGLEEYPTRFWAYVAIALLSLLLLTMIFKYYKRNRKLFLRRALCGVAFVSLLYSLFFITLGKTQSEDAHNEVIPYALNGGADLDLPDTKNCRSDFYNAMDNQAMFWQIPSIQAFHSIVPGSIMEFYPTIGVTRDVGSRPDTSTYGLRALTSCRWLFDGIRDAKHFGGPNRLSPEMPGWKYYGTQNGFDVWENEYYIPFGFSYDNYVTRAQYDAEDESNRHLLLLRAMVLTDGQAKKYGGLLTRLDTDEMEYSQNEYFENCLARKSMACTDFSRDSGGFSARFTSEKERLVFFSVPYEEGWSATVNGKPAEVEKVSVGFMAVKVPAGTSQIRFNYRTPGLMLGILAGAGGAALFAVYLIFVRRSDRKNKQEHRRTVFRISARPKDAEENNTEE